MEVPLYMKIKITNLRNKALIGALSQDEILISLVYCQKLEAKVNLQFLSNFELISRKFL